MESFAALAREIAVLTGTACAEAPERTVAGGSINTCYYWASGLGPMFVKVGPRASHAAFTAEVDGLRELRATRALRVPGVLAVGLAGTAAFLALEWIEQGPGGAACERRLGEGLAALHAVTTPRFGWWRDNTIGRTPQANAWNAGWREFFRGCRARPPRAPRGRQGVSRAVGRRACARVRTPAA